MDLDNRLKEYPSFWKQELLFHITLTLILYNHSIVTLSTLRILCSRVIIKLGFEIDYTDEELLACYYTDRNNQQKITVFNPEMNMIKDKPVIDQDIIKIVQSAIDDAINELEFLELLK